MDQMTAEMVPCMHMDNRRKIRENYVCAYSLARMLTADLAQIIQLNLPENTLEEWNKSFCIITRC